MDLDDFSFFPSFGGHAQRKAGGPVVGKSQLPPAPEKDVPPDDEVLPVCRDNGSPKPGNDCKNEGARGPHDWPYDSEQNADAQCRDPRVTGLVRNGEKSIESEQQCHGYSQKEAKQQHEPGEKRQGAFAVGDHNGIPDDVHKLKAVSKSCDCECTRYSVPGSSSPAAVVTARNGSNGKKSGQRQESGQEQARNSNSNPRSRDLRERSVVSACAMRTARV